MAMGPSGRSSTTPSNMQKPPPKPHLAGKILLFGSTTAAENRDLSDDSTRPSDRHLIENGARLSEALVASCRGNTNPIRMFSAKELMEATDCYDQRRLAASGASQLYCGFHDGRPIAVKVAGTSVLQHAVRGLSDMLLNEVVCLSQINHRNVVRLLGCCMETRTPILVCEFVSGGSLHQHIHSADASRRIPWPARLRIALEVADALNYLHTALHTPLVHGNVQSSSILLDDGCSAKVANFGFSELVPREGMRAPWKGSQGTGIGSSNANFNPRCDFGQPVTEKSDVYGFGLVLIELMTGREPVGRGFKGSHTISLESFVSSVQEGLLGSALDGGVSSEANPEQLTACARVAIRSVAGDVEERPTMRELVQELRCIRG